MRRRVVTEELVRVALQVLAELAEMRAQVAAMRATMVESVPVEAS